ncbi:hypothetical protein E2C01_054637 [Portunus trituberculatus]|uniref:Secreted protein n=1 Tax=Portunus trituberculatus TaxID=210409 RepID=A0A5B7GVJ1_PORTR|nr:hypothetical protein [Portunus trituberculatus]
MVVVVVVVVELSCTKLSVTVLESGVAPKSAAPSHVPPSGKASPGPPCPQSLSFFLDDLPQPEVRVPRREKARITMGELGTLLGRGVSMSGTCKYSC